MLLPLKYPYLDKLLGTYESEIWLAIDILRKISFEKIINIGASYGYYSVGFALIWPKAIVYSFEMKLEKHRIISHIAKENEVSERIEIRGVCDSVSLSQLLDKPKYTLIMCEIEGQEKSLLNPQKIPALERSYILVELHDHLIESSSQAIRNRFSQTHSIESFFTRLRQINDFPIHNLIINNRATKNILFHIMDERRRSKRQIFFLMLPKEQRQ